MVLLAAAICTKSGKALVSRQFVEMTRSRIEGLLASFPKLIGSGSKQHTFVETESVRYVYQPMEKLYMLLITTKASNILEDLETLRLFSRVIPEYCKNIDEKEITDHAFDLIFAFDEIVALGYRENVNLAQIRTFTDMDSHEEKVFKAMRETQEREAKEKMKQMAREIQMAKSAAKLGGGGGSSGGFGSSRFSSMGSSGSTGISSSSYDTSAVKDTISPPSFSSGSSSSNRPNKAMKLGNKDAVPAFVEQAVKQVSSMKISESEPLAPSTSAHVQTEKVHLKVDEKITMTCGRDGGLQNLEVHGILLLRVASEDCGKIKVKVQNNDSRNVQLQTHPNVDKKLFTSGSIIGLKDASKSFPPGQDVGVLKWRFQTQDESEIPLTINCWPSETRNGCDVNIEYELQKTNLELNNVIIVVAMPTNIAAPIIKQCDGSYTYEKYKNHLVWRLDTISDANANGCIEFSVSGGHTSDFFPVNVTFTSNKSYIDIQATGVYDAETTSPNKYSHETHFTVDKYEII